MKDQLINPKHFHRETTTKQNTVAMSTKGVELGMGERGGGREKQNVICLLILPEPYLNVITVFEEPLLELVHLPSNSLMS